MPRRLTSTIGLSREEWLERRSAGLGGSDAAKVFGLLPYPDSTPYALWLKKTGQLPPEEESSEAAHFGTVLESVVASEFMERSKELYGSEMKLRRANYIFQHEKYPWMIADVDRMVVGQPDAGFEAKTANAFLADEWKDDKVPDAYYVQCQHYMAVMNWNVVYIACLIGGQTFVTKPVMRSDEFIKAMIEREGEFWNENVVKGIAPPMIAADDPTLYHPDQTNETWAPATEHAREMAKSLDSVRRSIRALKSQEEELKNNLAMMCGDRIGIEGICTWKQNKASMKTDWQGLAIELGASTDQIEKYTTEKPGARVLKVILKGVA